jgi:protein-S-isoprenylcysteine O-methyltransferase Ste14
MNQDVLFHRIFVALFLSVVAIRIYYAWRARLWKRDRLHRETAIPERGIMLLRVFVAVPVIALTFWFMAAPGRLAWMHLPVPAWLRWFGVVQSLLGIAGLVWIHHHLGKNFSTELRIRQDHSLITSGPYRYVRHPMYSNFLLNFPGLPIVGANWLLLLFFVIGLVFIVTVRIRKEEQLMLATFGDEYRAYMARTGRLFPRVRSRQATANAA